MQTQIRNHAFFTAGISVLFGSVVSGFTFKPYVTSHGQKMATLGLTIATSGIFILAVPFATSLPQLLALVSIKDVLMGYWSCASVGMIVYTLGPVSLAMSCLTIMCGI